jgi:threonylcarbamoyladenosine tRNA methylthiotransferase MtaB
LGGPEKRGFDGGQAFRFSPSSFSFHSRPYLKIQDGCNRRCAYCRVPLARGPSVSLDPEAALERLRRLEEAGFAEAVLTGVNIAQYRSPACGEGDVYGLGELLLFLLKNTSTIALRLSSIEPEPGFLEGAFAEAVKDSRIRPHFHLSVQSGSDRVLKAMARPYGREDIIKAADTLRKLKGDPFLACDIITGFPGESPADFGQSFDLCAGVDFAWIHGFTFSPRPGTAAFSLPHRVSEREAVERLERLAGLAERGKRAFVARQQGKTVQAVVAGSKKVPFLSLVTDNYIKVRAPFPSGREIQPKAGSALLCRIGPYAGNGFDAEGEIVVY